MKKFLLGFIFTLSVNSAFAESVDLGYLGDGDGSFATTKSLNYSSLGRNDLFEDIYTFDLNEDTGENSFLLKAKSNRIYQSLSDGSSVDFRNIANFNYSIFDSKNNEIPNTVTSLDAGNYMVKVSGEVSALVSGSYSIFIGFGENVSSSFEAISESFYIPDIDLSLPDPDMGNLPSLAVPEPSTYSTMAVGLVFMGVIAYRRRKTIS